MKLAKRMVILEKLGDEYSLKILSDIQTLMSMGGDNIISYDTPELPDFNGVLPSGLVVIPPAGMEFPDWMYEKQIGFNGMLQRYQPVKAYGDDGAAEFDAEEQQVAFPQNLGEAADLWLGTIWTNELYAITNVTVGLQAGKKIMDAARLAYSVLPLCTMVKARLRLPLGVITNEERATAFGSGLANNIGAIFRTM